MHAIKKAVIVAGALLGWLAVVLQFYLIFTGGEAAPHLRVLRFFSFFTIVGNITIALLFTRLALPGQAPFKGAWRVMSPTIVATFGLLVSGVYHAMLTDAWNPQGLQYVVDRLLHLVNPLMVLAYWVLFEPKRQIGWATLPRVTVIPLAYFLYVLALGALTGKYPYYFFNIQEEGLGPVMLTALVLLLIFAVVCALLVVVAKLISRAKAVQAGSHTP